ncbi:MAG: MmgE/PrpD family protein, partial [Desulfuromonadales bacterium]|nr:MmgE/PrpD family protein [Desulfuromonadales bacterium]
MNPDQNRAVAAYLGELVEQLAATPVEPADRGIVRQHLLDSIAAGLIGSGSGIYRDLLRTCGRPGATEGGHNPLDAAMLWAFAINGSVFEDGSKEGACHPAAAVMPVVFAFGQGKSWELIDRAVIAGYDVMVRLARGGNPQLTLKGFHPTAIFAPFGAAATLAVLQGFTPQQTLHALSLAAQGSGGLMAAFKCGPTQPLQVAWSVRNG